VTKFKKSTTLSKPISPQRPLRNPITPVGVSLSMSIQNRCLLGIAVVCATLLLVLSVFLPKEHEQSIGIPVLLSHRCTPQQIENRGDGREVVVQFRLDHSSFVNSDLMPVEDDLRRQIVGLMAIRQEQTVFFAADDQLTYGEVSAVLSYLRKRDPALNVVLLTKKQIGVERKFDWTQLAELCLFAPSSLLDANY
jgi:biopolymer transport protein ExbD